MKYVEPIMEIFELDSDIVITSGLTDGGRGDGGSESAEDWGL